MSRVTENFAYYFHMIDGICFVTGFKIEYFAKSTVKSATAAENFASGEVGYKNNVVWRGNAPMV